VAIDSYPTALNGIAEFRTDAIAWNYYPYFTGYNSFTVSNGQITSAQFLSLEEIPVGNSSNIGEFLLNEGGTNALLFQGTSPPYPNLENNFGFAGVSFEPAATPNRRPSRCWHRASSPSVGLAILDGDGQQPQARPH
jgi:hypothetical protein